MSFLNLVCVVEHLSIEKCKVGLLRRNGSSTLAPRHPVEKKGEGKREESEKGGENVERETLINMVGVYIKMSE